MNDEFRAQAYKLLDEFIGAVSRDDWQELNNHFDVSEALAEEIQEMIHEYYPNEDFSLGIAPFGSAFSKEKRKRPDIELFEMNDGDRWGVECVLWVNGKPSEPILHVELFWKASDLRLQYKYIGS